MTATKLLLAEGLALSSPASSSAAAVSDTTTPSGTRRNAELSIKALNVAGGLQMWTRTVDPDFPMY